MTPYPAVPEYQSPQGKLVPRKWLLNTLTGVLSAGFVIIESPLLVVAEHQTLMEARISGCGTGRHTAEFTLIYELPVLIILSVGGWLVARWAGSGQRLCRYAFWSSLTAWLTCVVMVRHL